jgi:hypothetical protein
MATTVSPLTFGSAPIAIRGTNLAVVKPEALVVVDLQTGASRNIATFPNGDCGCDLVGDLAIDDTYAYFTDGEVRRARLDATAVETLAGTGDADRLIVDDLGIVVSLSRGGPSAAGSLREIHLDGTTRVLLDEDPGRFALTDTDVVWWDGTAIVKTSRRP